MNQRSWQRDTVLLTMTTAMDRMLFADDRISGNASFARASRVVPKRSHRGQKKAVIPARQSSWSADELRKIRAQ